MKALKTISVLAGLGLIGYALYRYYLKQVDFIRDITYQITGIRIKEFKKDKVSLDISALIFNASNVEAVVTQMYLDVFINGINVGNVNQGYNHISEEIHKYSI